MKWALLTFTIMSSCAYAIPTQTKNGFLFIETVMAVFAGILAYWLYWQSGLF